MERPGSMMIGEIGQQSEGGTDSWPPGRADPETARVGEALQPVPDRLRGRGADSVSRGFEGAGRGCRRRIRAPRAPAKGIETR